LSISVFLSGLSLASFAAAQTSPVVTSTHAQLIHSLRQAHHLLVAADHDYDGHRARAAEEVHKAIKELEGKHNVKGILPGSTSTATVVANKVSKVRQPAMRESQSNSDAQLRQAQAILQGALAELNSHHPRASANVNAAIAQICTALKLK